MRCISVNCARAHNGRSFVSYRVYRRRCPGRKRCGLRRRAIPIMRKTKQVRVTEKKKKKIVCVGKKKIRLFSTRSATRRKKCIIYWGRKKKSTTTKKKKKYELLWKMSHTKGCNILYIVYSE